MTTWKNTMTLIVGLASLAAACRCDGQGKPKDAVTNPVIGKYPENIVFFLNFDDGDAVPEVSAKNPRPPSTRGTVTYAKGLLNQCLRSGLITVPGTGNIDFAKPGTAIFWIAPLNWDREAKPDYFWPMIVLMKGEKLSVGRQAAKTWGKTTIYAYLTVPRKADIVYLPIYGQGGETWEDGVWHMVALTWDAGELGLSVDGKPQKRKILPAPMKASAWIRLGTQKEPRDVNQNLLDEVVVLDKRLDDDELKTLYEETITMSESRKKPTATAQKRKLELPSIIGDHMVLQADGKVPIWGTAPSGETVKVSLRGEDGEMTTGEDGKWRLEIGPFNAGGPDEMIVATSTSSITIKDVLVGEVWLCSGQSNMAMSLNASANGKEEATKALDGELRFFKTPMRPALEPEEDCDGKWVVCSPKTAGGFSAVGYYFGKDLRETLKVPVGLIQSTWGGTGAESWISVEGMIPEPVLEPKIEEVERSVKTARAIPKNVKEDDANWMKPDFDDASWKTIRLPRYWDYDLYPVEGDGVIWARKTIQIPDDWEGETLVLSLAKIDDYETTYFNGVEVGGETKHTLKPRSYQIPGKLVGKGRAVVAVKTFKVGWGGIFGKKEEMSLATADKTENRMPMDGEWKYEIAKFEFKNYSPRLPASLFNGMVNPLIPYAIRGAIWYQGEANANSETAFSYRRILPAMIHDWRGRWSRGDFPFYIVQLPNFNSGRGDCWPILRESQCETVAAVPNTDMAVTIDLGEPGDIHPKNKRDVGTRLALLALAETYGEDVECHGPIFERIMIEGSKIRLSFANANGGLISKDGPLKSFEIAGSDGKFVPAEARIDGNDVVVSSPDLKHPVAARYAWKDNPEGCDLRNQARLPASPFRTKLNSRSPK